jgi:hypothetical protein
MTDGEAVRGLGNEPDDARSATGVRVDPIEGKARGLVGRAPRLSASRAACLVAIGGHVKRKALRLVLSVYEHSGLHVDEHIEESRKPSSVSFSKTLAAAVGLMPSLRGLAF